MTSKMMEDKVVVVTGAGGGIGRDIAILMAREGARVIVNDVGVSLSGEGGSSTPAQETKRLIEEAGGAAEICAESVSNWSSAGKIIQSAMDHFGRLDAVVNNAGILRDAIFHKMNEEEWRAVIDVHLHGSFFVSRAAAEIFRKQESGAFVHMSSTSGLIGNFGQANYSAAKMGIVGLSKSIALDMHRYNVRSNCIAPSAWSRMTHAIPATTPDQEMRIERLKRMTPAKNAPLTVFLASDAAKDVTGQIFAVRMNEIFLISANRPVRGMHRADGWTPKSISEELIPAVRPMFTPLDRTQDVFPWDPI
ncbi:SDR family NAD(P)-dependent oxidoreductase [Xanthobacter sp. DSM 24535]|uniref:SDR family NAD(P)-dependent oxidoreductase n=1 Tax=Roseixanthobacter psychrophilus TaxID=3119917 RepID=UPI00372A8432